MIKKQFNARLQYCSDSNSVLEVNYTYEYLLCISFNEDYIFNTVIKKDYFDLVHVEEDLRTLEEDTFFQKSIAHDLPVPLEFIRAVQNYIPIISKQYQNCTGIRVDYHVYTFEY